MPIAIEIEEHGRHAPAAVARAAGDRDVGERSIAVVVKELVRSELRQVDVRAAVAVVIADRDAHPVAAAVQPALVRDIGEVERTRAVSLRATPRRSDSGHRITRIPSGSELEWEAG